MTTKQLHAVMLLFTMLSAFLQMRALSDTIPYVNQYNPQGLHCFISPSNSWGIADQDGAIILDPVYMMIDDKYEYAGLFLFSNDGLEWGFYDCMTGYISEQSYINIYVNRDPNSDYIALDEGGYNGLGFFSRKEQKMVIEPQYNGENYTEFSYGWAWVMRVNNNDMDDFDLFLINESNEKLELDDGIIPLSNFSQGRCRVYSESTQLEGFIDVYGNIVIDLQYISAWDFDENGYAKVWDQEDRCWKIDVDGNPVSP